MPAEGMVHTLRRAAELVAPNGLLLDLHPTADNADLAVVDHDGAAEIVGPVLSKTAAQRHANADAAVAAALQEGFVTRTGADVFVFSRYCPSLDELVSYVETDWHAWFDATTLERARRRLATGTMLRLSERVAITAFRTVSNPQRAIEIELR